MDIVLPDLWVPVVAAFLPVLTALAAKAEAGDNTRRVIAVVLAAAVAVVNAFLDSGGVSTVEVLVSTFLVAMGTQVVAYLSAWKGADVNARVAPRLGVVR